MDDCVTLNIVCSRERERQVYEYAGELERLTYVLRELSSFGWEIRAVYRTEAEMN